MSLKDVILKSSDRKTRLVPTPEWECASVRVRTLSAADRHRLNQKIQALKGTPDEAQGAGLMAANIICDESGQRVFDDGDAKALSEKAGPVLDRLVEEWRKLNALTAEEVKNLEKNSLTPPSGN